MDKLIEGLQKMNMTLVNYDQIEDENYKFSIQNKNKITVKPACGHELVRTISTLYSKRNGGDHGIVCKHCNTKKNHQYENGNKTCSLCDHVNINVPSTNLGVFRCRYCQHDETKVETKLYKFLVDKGYKIGKSYWFKNDGSLTGDFYFVDDDGTTVVIEVDENNHKKAHLKSHQDKDNIVLNGTGVKMIRFHAKDLDKFKDVFEEYLKRDDLIQVAILSKTSKKLYESIYATIPKGVVLVE